MLCRYRRCVLLAWTAQVRKQSREVDERDALVLAPACPAFRCGVQTKGPACPLTHPHASAARAHASESS